MMKLRKLILAAAVGLLPIQMATAADAPGRPSVESFFANAELSGARISPNGEYIAAMIRVAGSRAQLAVINAKAPDQIKIVMAYKNSDVVSVYWVNDERLLFRVNDNEQESRIDGALFAVNKDGEHLRQLTTTDWDYVQESAGSSIRRKVLPAEYRFANTLNDGSSNVVVLHHSFNNLDRRVNSTRLHLLDTKTGKLSDLPSGKIPEHVKRWVLDGEGRPRIATAFRNGRQITYYRAAGSEDWTELQSSEYHSSEAFTPIFVDNDDTLIVEAATKQGITGLYRYDPTQKKLADEPFFKVDGFDFNGGLETDLAAKKAIGIRYRSDAGGTVWLDPRMKDIQKKVDAALPTTINTLSCGNCLSSPTMLVTFESDRQPKRYAIYNVATERLTLFGSSYPKINAAQMGRRDFFRVSARDGLRIPVYLTLPPGKPNGPQPTVVLVHGGPFTRGSYWEYDEEAQFLASRGYVVIQPEFRGSTGFGFKHFQAGWQQWGKSMQDDVTDATKWAIAKGYADPKRIAIAGASYGGYSTLMGLIREPELYRCGVAWVAVTDMDLLYSQTWSDISDEALKYGMGALIGDREADAARLKETSPVTHADKIKQPVLLAYGAKDERVPVVHGTRFRSAVEKSSKEVEWVVYNDEGHNWFYEKTRYDFWKRVEAFLEKHLAVPN